MSRFADWSVRRYAALLRLYPRAFRAEFADEMQSVFAEGLAEAAWHGMGPMLIFCGRELAGLSGSVLLEQVRAASRRQVALTALFFLSLLLAGWLLAANLLGFGLLSSPLSWIIASGAWCLVGLGLAAVARRQSPGVWVAVALIILAAFAVMPTSLSVEFPQNLSLSLPSMVAYPLLLTLCLMPSLALVVVALLLYSGLTGCRHWRNRVSAGDGVLRGGRAPRLAVIALVLSLLLLLVALYNLYWGLVWDSTYDPLDVLWLPFPLLAALSSGLLLVVTLPGRMKFAGWLYWLLIPVLTIGVYAAAKSVNTRQLTEERAGQLSGAVESYYAREGRYPRDLGQLTPGYMLSLPAPLIINGQDWCYDSGAVYYRLGYADREHWSSPNFFGHLVRTQGVVPPLQPLCAAQITNLRKRFSEIDQ